jgi:hypothetical protein
MASLCLAMLRQEKWAEAEPILRECLAIREKVMPDEWPRFNTMSQLGVSLLGQKKYAEAEPLIVSGYEGLKARESKIPPPGKPRLPEAALAVVKLYEAWVSPTGPRPGRRGSASWIYLPTCSPARDLVRFFSAGPRALDRDRASGNLVVLRQRRTGSVAGEMSGRAVETPCRGRRGGSARAFRPRGWATCLP